MQKLALLVLALAVLYGSAEQLKCASKEKYFIPNFTANWFRAVEYCNSLDMRLAVTATKDEHTSLIEFVKRSDMFSNDGTMFWIGANDLAEEGIFYWHATGARVQNALWSPGQPDNAGNVEHCVEVRYFPAVGLLWSWNDRVCNATRNFVCENRTPGQMVMLF